MYELLYYHVHYNVHYNVRADPVPRLVQYDWVAMFSPEPTQFIEKAMPWIGKRRNTKISSELLNPHLPISMNIGEKGAKNVKNVKNKKKDRVIQEVTGDGSVIEIKGEGSKESDITDDIDLSDNKNDNMTSGEIENKNGMKDSGEKNDNEEENEDENEMLKLRVVDVFDRMKDIVIAMNAFGEGKVGELY